jgi:hypothetical protein
MVVVAVRDGLRVVHAQSRVRASAAWLGMVLERSGTVWVCAQYDTCDGAVPSTQRPSGCLCGNREQSVCLRQTLTQCVLSKLPAQLMKQHQASVMLLGTQTCLQRQAGSAVYLLCSFA